ncbi:site-2 protease family protein [Gallaecimonas kandeliae]|uniref:metalloprotease n=1 Tax=Gallaecimonas kandeliae TaxID=3029055 RepID=UPI002647EBC7|nr:site-2 protease family protein [Gallaecimonas kandeliae]WKE66410.1 site-2 protease family protein [Gallaecimonas kandeliae]
MELTFQCGPYHFSLSRQGGSEQLRVDHKPVSVRAAQGNLSEHRFLLDGQDWQLQLSLHPEQGHFRYRLLSGDALAGEGQAPLAMAQPQGEAESHTERHGKGFGWLALGLKLFKSASAIKVVLAGASFASYAYLFNWKLALVLIAILVFHEYGHLRAMQRFNIPTKGIYLIPFFGGAAVSSERFKTQWQEVFVAMAGPTAGLLMCLLAWVGWRLSASPWLGAVVSLGAFLNLFNLLPIHPLDGGRVLKAVMASSRNPIAFYAVLALSALGFALSLYFGFMLLAILLVAGLADLLGERNNPSQQLAMNKWGMMVSGAWYLAVFLALLGLVVLMANSGLPGTEIPHLLLSS